MEVKLLAVGKAREDIASHLNSFTKMLSFEETSWLKLFFISIVVLTLRKDVLHLRFNHSDSVFVPIMVCNKQTNNTTNSCWVLTR